MRTLRRAVALVTLALAASCGATVETSNPATPALGAGTYRLVASDASFSASFAVTTTTGPTTVTRGGYLEALNAQTVAVNYGGTGTIATLTATGFSVLLGTLTLGFTRQ